MEYVDLAASKASTVLKYLLKVNAPAIHLIWKRQNEYFYIWYFDINFRANASVLLLKQIFNLAVLDRM